MRTADGRAAEQAGTVKILDPEPFTIIIPGVKWSYDHIFLYCGLYTKMLYMYQDV